LVFKDEIITCAVKSIQVFASSWAYVTGVLSSYPIARITLGTSWIGDEIFPHTCFAINITIYRKIDAKEQRTEALLPISQNKVSDSINKNY